MGSWLRNLNGYRRYLQHEITFAELKREYPELDASRSRSKIPDPWDDYPRRDAYDRSWKRHRKTKYRAPQLPTQKRARPYDTPWTIRRGRYAWVSPRRCDQLRVRYRVRESYRRHKVDKVV
jgi:hypothetical protein